MPSLLEFTIPVLDSGWNYNSSPLFHYAVAISVLIKDSEFFARFPSVIFGILTIILAYFIAREYSKFAGIISALFFSVFYLEVFYSRQARFYQLFQLLFFLSIYLLYKSKQNPKFLYFAVASFLLTVITHLEGLILAPFFIFHIFYFNRKKWYFLLLPLIISVRETSSVKYLVSKNFIITYAKGYFSYAFNMYYLLILCVPGIIWSYLKNKRLTLLIILPSIVGIVGIISMQTFALRYIYFAVFPLLLFSSVLMSLLFEKYGEIIIIPLVLVLILPSNLFFEHNYINIIKPISKNLEDPSAPFTNYKNLPEELISDIRNTTLISYFSPDVEYYIKKPDFVIPFTMDGRGDDQISTRNSEGKLVDIYSGSPILTNTSVGKPYFLITDAFSFSKLKPRQFQFHLSMTQNCTVSYGSYDFQIYNCIE